MRHRGILPPRMAELARREADDRTLVCYGSKGWYMIANEDDVTRQSVVLTTHEVRWLADLWSGDVEDLSPRLAAIEKRAKRPAWNWKQLTTRDVPWLVRKLRERCSG